MKNKLLLISNSKMFNKGYLEHVTEELEVFLKGKKQVLFVPFALKDHDGYAAVAGKKFTGMGLSFASLHREKDMKKAVSRAECIFVGGGNTFRLLKTLYEYNLISPIREAVRQGTLYIGSSAGSNIAAPTIKTTNDMPIVMPPSFAALDLVPFQINPHYLDTNAKSTHMGETREQRLREFHEENDTPVVGLREGSWIRVEGSVYTLKGSTGAKIFVKGKEPYEATSMSDLKYA